MTTQSDVTRSNETIHIPVQIKKPFVQIAIAAILITAIITTSFLMISAREEVKTGNNQAVEVDIGEFKMGIDVPNTYEELLRLSYHISEFVSEKAPGLVSVVENEMNEVISQYKLKDSS